MLALVREQLARSRHRGEQIAAIVQFIVFSILALIYFFTSNDVFLEKKISVVPVIFGIYLPFLVAKVWLLRFRDLDQVERHVCVLLDVFAVAAVIFSYHLEYAVPMAAILKSPSFSLFFIVIALRMLIFEVATILSAGAATVIAWSVMVLYSHANEKSDVTHSFREYILEQKLLVGAEVEKMLIVVVVMSILAVAVIQFTQVFRDALFAFARARGELKVVNDSLVVARDQALSANRAKSAFLRSMSHELRTPLVPIIGYGELLEEMELGVEEIGKTIAIEGAKLLRQIDAILEMVEIESGKVNVEWRKLEFKSFIEEITEPLTRQFGDRIDIVQQSKSFEFVTGKAQLTSVLTHIIRNALQSSDDGQVVVSITEYPTEYQIFVEDQGKGIPASKLEQIKEAFNQVDDGAFTNQDGLGLGLTLALRYAKIIKGELKIDSSEGRGTTAIVEIPRLNESIVRLTA